MMHALRAAACDGRAIGIGDDSGRAAPRASLRWIQWRSRRGRDGPAPRAIFDEAPSVTQHSSPLLRSPRTSMVWH